MQILKYYVLNRLIISFTCVVCIRHSREDEVIVSLRQVVKDGPLSFDLGMRENLN